MAIMIVEKSAFEVSAVTAAVTDTAAAAAPTRGRGRRRGRGTGGRGGTGQRGGKSQGKDYADSHGLKRGWSRGVDDLITPLHDSGAEIPPDAPAEGLYAVIQATICRRVILSRVFKNVAPSMSSLVFI